jgi:hypothetical protein
MEYPKGSICELHGLANSPRMNGAIVQLIGDWSEREVLTDGEKLVHGRWVRVEVIATLRADGYVAAVPNLGGFAQEINLRPSRLFADPATPREVVEMVLFGKSIEAERAKQVHDFTDIMEYWEDYKRTALRGIPAGVQKSFYNVFLAGAWAYISLQDKAVIKNTSEDIAEERVMQIRKRVMRLLEESAREGGVSL